MLELLSHRAPLHETLTVLCEMLEEHLPLARCSVLLLDANTGTLHHGAGPQLPKVYCEAIDGAPIGPRAGSCGTAAFERREVMVEDIARDPLWEEYRALALPHALAACASIPIFDAQEDVLGTFAIYHRQTGPFETRELALLRDVSGLAALAIASDRRDAALHASEERFRVVTEQTGHVIYDVDAAAGTAVWAGAIEAICGEPPEAFDGLTMDGWLARVHPDDAGRVRAHLARGGPANTRAAVHLEYRARDASGSFRDVEQRGVLAFDSSGAPARLFGVLADVSERRRAETALQQGQKLDSLGVLAGGIAHDFNNLLAAMLGNLNLAEMNLSVLSPALPYLKDLEAVVLRAADLTKQMLAYSGKGRFIVKPVDLSGLVQEMAHLLSVILPKTVSLRLLLAPELPLVVADVAQIQQVVMNLVTNAAEAIGDREGTVILTTATLDIDEAYIASAFAGQPMRPGRYVALEVSDTGCGMTPEVILKIFDPFFTTKRSGRGLGLSAMLGILRGHGAGLKIDSEPDRGSTFKVYFPATGDRQEESVRTPQVVAAVARPSGIALVVDDEPSLRRITGQVLREIGFDVLEAANGLEAVELVRKHRSAITLVVMDMTMPRMGGKEAFSGIRSVEPTLPIILCSGYNEQEAIQQFLGKGLACFLQKPYQRKDLEEAVRAALAARTAR